MNNKLLSEQWITEDIKREVGKFLGTNEDTKQHTGMHRRWQKPSKRAVYSNYQEIQKASDNLSMHLKEPKNNKPNHKLAEIITIR